MKRSLIALMLLISAFAGAIMTQPTHAQTNALATVTAQELAIRNYPDFNTGQAIATLRYSQVFTVTARSSINDWWQLQLPDGRLGWVEAASIIISNPQLVPTITPTFPVSQPVPPQPQPIPTTPTATITSAVLNVRDFPDTVYGRVLAQVSQNQRFTVVGRSSANNWWQILLSNGPAGWVSGDYVSVTNGNLVPVIGINLPGGATGTVTASFLNVRHAPNAINGVVIARISRNQTFDVVGKNINNVSTWWQIRLADGRLGWVNGRYLAVLGGEAVPVTDNSVPPTMPPTNTTTTGTVTAYFLNVRSLPDPVNGEVLTVISRGQPYTVIGRNSTNTWFLVQTGTPITGWVSGAYFSVINPWIVPIIS